MKKKIAWITDSTASLSKQFIEDNHIHVIPLNIIFGDESYKEDVTITSQEFYKRLSEEKELPKTSQPAIGEFIELYETLKNEYEHAIAIHCTDKLSGTLKSSQSAAEMAGFNLEVIDSKIGSFPLARMLEEGIKLENEGKSFGEIVEFLRQLPDRARLILSPASLEQLHKGGRMSGSQLFFGSLLQINIIFEFIDGRPELIEKIRTEKKIKKRIFEMLNEAINTRSDIKEVSIIHADDETKADEWKKELEVSFPFLSFTKTMLSPVPGAHVGKGTIGLGWL